MSFEGWFWLILNVVLSAACIRQFWLLLQELAIPEEWPDLVASHEAPKEADYVADKDGA